MADINDPAPLPGVAAPWYTSQVQKAQVVSAVTALIALFPKAGTLLGIKTPDQVAVWVESIFGIATLAAPLVGILWRSRSKLQPLAWTKARAAATPAVPIQAAPPVVVDPKLEANPNAKAPTYPPGPAV
jgi:hypothetical protein